MYNNVLIIDDSRIDRFISETVISKDLFAENIASVNSVKEGLQYLQSLVSSPEKLPSIIFLDVNMPGMDGFDFLDHFLKFPEDIQKRCAIFMISATNSVDDLKRIKDYPVIRKFFNKPLTQDMLRIIRTYMEAGVS